VSCVVNLVVQYAGGQPASFASVVVNRVNRVFWGEFETWVTSKTCDVNGKVSFTLVKGAKYHFIYSVKDKRGDFWQTLTTCPTWISAAFR